MQPAAVGANDFDVQVPNAELFSALRQPAEMGQDEPADRIELLVTEVGSESPVEVVDLRLRLDAELAVAGE